MKAINTIAALLFAAFTASQLQADSEYPIRPPDQVIQRDVDEELRSLIHRIPAAVEARVVAGEVTLQGGVSSFLDRMRIGRRVAGVEGVSRVNNRLRVERMPVRTQQRDDRTVDRRDDFADLSKKQPAGKHTLRGMIDSKREGMLVVRDFRAGRSEVAMLDATEVTLNGARVDGDQIDEGLLVFIRGRRDGGRLVAASVEAYSPD
ncbi:BON domain-containing protein [Rosistilla oblonga]|uniref:BON domain protein n=1 Tax=Rosistilla oblonga TaxID=2527990 RepID=A0A518IV07_9BACT|nr:BON domain-containing protein [Rosistilla oblonga]QDV56924.1 BON domain protein [Rosistilla oblonga]